MRIGVPREIAPGERRVALLPDIAARLVAAGHEVIIESGAGAEAFSADDLYREQNASVVGSSEELFSSADVICKVLAPSPDEITSMPEGAAIVSFYQPHSDLKVLEALARQRVSSFSLDLLPRISRAQSMDALSSQSTVTGYLGALLAASHLPKFFPMFMSAAGTIPPARVLVLGAGVAGLQAIATARRLGAVVRAHDVRPTSAEEVRSLGAVFVELEIEAQVGVGGYAANQSEDFLSRQRELISNEVASAGAVITTAAIPGRTAPVLVTKEMVEQMAPGSVIVDLAAETGGNCELSKPGEQVLHGGVSIIGVQNLASSMPIHASFLYSRNIFEFIGLLTKDGTFAPDFEDEIVSATCVTLAGEVRDEALRELLKDQVS